MQVNITARHIEVNDDFKSYVTDKLDKLERYSNKIEEARAIFFVEKQNHVSEIVLTGKRFRITSTEKDEDLRTSFDLSISSAEKQLKKVRDKVKDHKIKRFIEGVKRITKKKKRTEITPNIIKMDSLAKKPMSPEEAALELEVFNQNFMVFRNSTTDEINVLYHRNDGNYGLIES